MNLVASAATPRIYMVEDNEIIAFSLLESLHALGYSVVGHAERGADALVEIQQVRPDVVLMDVQLRDHLTGIEVASRLHRVMPGLPIIFLSGSIDERLVDAAIASGSNAYLLKPVEEQALRVNIEMVLLRQRLEQQLREANLLLEQRNSELQQALESVKQLSGLLPICVGCKSVRDDQNYWRSLDSYLTTHADVQLSHALCPHCLEKQLRELDAA